MADFFDKVVDGMQLRLETRLLPPITFDLSSNPPGAPPNAYMEFLKPKYTITKGDSVITTQTPYGDPGNSANLFPIVVLLGVLLMLSAVLFLTG